MEQIVPPIVLAQKILGQQKVGEGTSYRLTTHCLRVEQPEWVLLYHTLTGELLRLSYEEAEELDGLSGSVSPALEALVSKRFLVPRGTDDMALADQVRQIAWQLNRNDGALTDYMIFTTTACNARCFYCFEAGIKKITMTEDTARAAGAYIADHCGGKPVDLLWFGGEPLVNTRAIDVITDVLVQRGTVFHASITTNGYLFDETMVRRAKDRWKLELAQITLDGTEAVYNQRKAYVHPEGSPFQRVLRNIGLLLDAGIRVVARLNMDGENEGDLYALVDQLAERFGGRPGFGVRCRVLVENKGVKPTAYTEGERFSLAEKAQAMWAYLDEKGIASEWERQQQLVLYSCRSDSPHAATITPEGRLGRCESHIDKGLWGSVFSDDRDEQVLRRWRERRPAEEVCKTCLLYPQCVRLKECVTRTERCSPIERAEMGLRLRRIILATFEDWKAEHPPV